MWRHSFIPAMRWKKVAWHSCRIAPSCSFAKNQALRLLSIRPHACQELYRKLSANWENRPLPRAVSRMLELGYLDDRDFACQSGQSPKGAGARDRFCGN